MTPTKVRVLEAAVELLGTEGLRSLTHARVDERAGLPKGSTSNYFRTRAQLLIGVSDWIGGRDLASADDIATAPTPPRTWWRAWPSGSRC
jgi:AcrR family transcriptional regulator